MLIKEEYTLDFVQLTKQEYEAFSRNHIYHNFMNSLQAFEVKEAYGYENHFVGVKEQNQILCASAITCTPVMKVFRYAYAQRGFLIDYEDKELLAYFTKHLKAYLKKQHVVFLRLDPYVLYQTYDVEGKPRAEVTSKNFFHVMRTLGYEHQGFPTGFTQESQVRWMMVLDLQGKNSEDILKDMDKRTRWSIHKAEKLMVEVKELPNNDILEFYNMMKHTSQAKGFPNIPLSHFRKQLEVYGKEHAKIMMAYLDCEKSKKALHDTLWKQYKELTEIEQYLHKIPNSKKYIKKKQSQLEMIGATKQQIRHMETLQEQHGNIINLAASFFILYEDEVVYVYSGAYDEFKEFNGPYAIQWYMLKEAIKQQVPRYNFYGTSGRLDEQAEDYGVYQFKKGFHAHMEELVGDFILPIHSILYTLYKRMKK